MPPSRDWKPAPRRGPRTRGSLLCITVRTTEAAADAVAEQIEVLFGCAPAICTDARSRRTEVTVYLDRRGGLKSSEMKSIRAALAQQRRAGLAVGTGRIRAWRLKREDWAESWKRHFKPMEIGRELLLKPSWSRRKPRRGQAVVVLDPGLSFGTGQHATTRFCLEQLVAARGLGKGQSFLDVGTGSGILAIAAAKLGYGPVEAFDSDPEAIRVARENARVNRVATRIQIWQADLRRLPRRSRAGFDVICANLTSDLLVEERGRILARLKPGGTLVLAGILTRDFAAVRKVFAAEGMKMTVRDIAGEWTSGSFRRLG